MSQIIHTYDKNKNKRVTIANVFSSTPTKSIIKHGNISLSEIDTGSSSSGGKITRNVRFQLRDLANKHERHLKKKKRSDIKRIVKNSDSKCEAKRTELINQSLNEERKKNLKNKKESVKKKLIVTQTKDKDSEWETESEKSVNELSIRSLSTSKDDERMKLFEDPCTPEKIRDTPKTYEEILLESPIIGSFRRRSCLVSKKNDIILQNELFPMNWLPSKIRNLDETIEDETLFDYEGNKKAHVSLQKPEIKSKQTSKNVSFSDLQSPTITFRRDWPIKTYSRKTTPHLTLSFELSPIKLMSFRPRLPKKTKNTPILPVMVCVYCFSISK
ncbi:hypothetical protein ALC62_04942 [Cyphomyrmex costatus]|uniref:Uncharacterized protein n=1 Tax=Cyphomyrmex costatus TaxID=456900 RepID=A0A195CUH7_9HYME|nr:hypothetical protein ALC62_04942 [Cyphomyrmex costatus]